jgi:DNA topoisomerase III
LKGDVVGAAEVQVLTRETTPPKRFTDGSLIEAMTGIARYVENPQIRQILRETDGIGTEATRAETIEILFRRGFLEKKKGRQITSTSTGRLLIDTLPTSATTPDMTALWEAGLRKIGDGNMTLDDFIGRVLTSLRSVVDAGKRGGPLRIPGAEPCPECEEGFLRERASKRGAFVGCTRYPDCRYIAGRGGAASGDDEDDDADEADNSEDAS